MVSQGCLPETIHQILQDTLCASNTRIGLHEPTFTGNEWAFVKDCLDTGWVSSVGRYVDLFERLVAEYTGVKYAVAVSNGTAALHLCLKLVGVSQGHEVLVPSLTFVATANAVVYCGAVPHFVDSELGTLGMDPDALELYLEEIAEVLPEGCVNKRTGRMIKAVIPMHTFGHPVRLDALSEVCSKYRITLIEDAAEALGSFYQGKHVGHWGVLSALSFNGNKIITTGGGGMILTNNEELGKRAKHLTTTAKLPHPWLFIHDEVGYNYRLPNLNAALGCAQMEQLPKFLRLKRALSERYIQAFANLEEVTLVTEPNLAKSNYWLNTLILDERVADLRDRILELTNRNGISTRPIWTLMHKLPMYMECPRMEVPVAELLEKCVLNIPSSPYLGGYHE